MSEGYYSLPEGLDADIEAHDRDVERYLSGDLAPGIFKARRVPRGIYEQRENGSYMMRVRVAGGKLSCSQAVKLAELSERFSNGLLHATTRQDMQIHDVKIEDTAEMMRELKSEGLTSKGGGGNTVRNVAACPFSGICPSEVFDVLPHAQAVTEYLITLDGSYNLPRKYKIAFSGCAADCALARAQDLGFIAKSKDGVPGFEMHAGGGMGARSRIADLMQEWVPATDVTRIAEAVRRIFDRTGDRHNRNKARLRFVFDRLGADAMREEISEETGLLKDSDVPLCEVKTAVREPGKAELPAEKVAEGSGLRYFRQHQDGYLTVLVHLPLGFVSASDFRLLAEAAEKYSEECALFTSRTQDLLIRFVKESDLETLGTELKKLSVNVVDPDPIDHFVACAGSSTCRLGLCLSRGAASACAEELKSLEEAGKVLDDLKINISGCPNSCGQHPMAEIGFFGAAQREGGRLLPAYRVVLGAKDGEDGARLSRSIGMVPARAMPAFLKTLAEDYHSGRDGDERFSGYFDRRGDAHFESILAGCQAVPSYEEQPEFYRDWGSDEDFSLAGRGAGECGAGAFEVISDDIDAARKALEHSDENSLSDAFLPTVRALLIARGVDTGDPAEILNEFEENFVDSGLVKGEYEPLRGLADQPAGEWSSLLRGKRPEIQSLLDRVALLYSTLDANLKFHPPEGDESVESSGVAAESVVEYDLKGVACPMNFVKAKLKLEGMDVGDTLRVVLDEGAPVNNVPASFKGEGQGVENLTDLGDGHWSVDIIKMK